ncbi:hypothetical protein FB565_003882 [Actinoplanes lutulentus]|uniref:Uncharacterized protein n=1 Tax=Actinoplanes lutulentus TaxID=1287878 RepID=A0A327ZN62_9ACTN|nr:MFS transporter [Actinoplanes lutulentus]MBB2944153.1 hypothetical protein [Actinoplanes lutulentus]RAK42614.1 hypothetical protein B0I29_102439 [Actinoplanes lutulentus]
MRQLNDLIADFWRDYAALVLLGGGLIGVFALIGLFVWAKKSQKPLRPVALAFSMNLALLLNAEGMWVIAVDQLKLPKIFAVLVFAVFEICFLTATSLAAEQYRRTTTYGPDGKIITPGHPGPMLYIAALIAAISGIIVASNAVTGTEKLLRLAVPCVIFLMWWAALTAAGQRVRRGRFAYSPRRMAERWGWLIPDDDPDLVRMAAERQVRRMVVNYHRVSGKRWPQAWWKSRLLKDARTAGEPVVADVVQQLARIQRVMDLLLPGGLQVAAPASAGVATELLTVSSSAEPVAELPVTAPAVPAAPLVQPVRFMQPVAQEETAVVSPVAEPRNGSVGIPVPVPAPRRSVEDLPGGTATVPAVVPAVTAPVPAAPVPTAPVSTAPVLTAPGSTAAVPTAPVIASASVPVPVPPVAIPAAPVSPAPAIPAWASIGTGARPAVSIVGSPWWRLAVDRLSKAVAQEISSEDLPDMTYTRIGELARNLASRNSELGEGVVRAFVNDYVRELNGEYGEVAYPWRDFLPEPATAAPGSAPWLAALEELHAALEEELSQGELPADPYDLAELLAPSAPRLDEDTIRGFIGDYLLALGGQPGSGGSQPWQHLMPRPQSARSASDEEILEVYGGQLEEYLAVNGRITRNRVQSITGIKSRLQADRIKVTLEERAGVPIG